MSDNTGDGSLRTNWFHILVALAETEMHGSAIARDVLEQTGGALRLWPATLYRTLDELDAEGLISELSDQERPAGESARRRFYSITPEGRNRLAAAVARMQDLAGLAKRRLEAVRT